MRACEDRLVTLSSLTHRLNNLQHETLQARMVNSFEIVLANDTIWWLLLETYMYMNIWHGGVWANFHKANLILYFSNQNIF
jgi:hypothetical protein